MIAEKRKNNTKIWLSMLLAVLCIVALGISLRSKKPNLDLIEMSKSDPLISEYPLIVKQFNFFQRNAFIELYEYTDMLSYTDTLIYYYFAYAATEHEKWEDISESTMKYLVNTDLSMHTIEDTINILYFYSLVCEKHKLPVLDDAVGFLSTVDTYLATEFDYSIYWLNNFWKFTESVDSIDPQGSYDGSFFLIDQISISKDDLLSKLSYDAIKSNYLGDKSDTQRSYENIVKSYDDNDIDIESVIIYLNLYPKEYIMEMPERLVEEVFRFCIDGYYSISPYVSFLGFKICETYNDLYSYEIMQLFSNKPISQFGFAPTVAQIIPTFRRLFQYSEICSLLDINLDKATLYEIADSIDTSRIMVEDFYYMSILAREYKDIIVDRDLLKEYVARAGASTVNNSNYFSYYYLVKAALINGVDCSDLVSKMDEFYASNNVEHIILDIWSDEIAYLFGKGEIDFEKYSVDILEYSGELEIEVYYRYVVFLMNTGNECSQKVMDKIQQAIGKYYIINDMGAGYWANPEFRYIDIARTYECLFLKNYVMSL